MTAEEPAGSASQRCRRKTPRCRGRRRATPTYLCGSGHHQIGKGFAIGNNSPRDRFAKIELNWAIAAIVITDDREKTAEMALSAISGGLHPNLEVDIQLSVEDILSSPYVAIGTHEQNVDHIREVRRLTSTSYVGVFPTRMDAFAPVLALLRGDQRHVSVT
jgi:hypothetical protein